MEENRESTFGRRWLAESLPLFLLTVVGYGVAFVFEGGYFSHFGLPWTLIEVELARVIGAIFSVLFALYCGYIVTDFLFPFWARVPSAIGSRLKLHSPIYAMLVLTGVVVGGRALYIFLLGTALTLFLDFVLPAVRRKNGLTYAQRIARSTQAELAGTSLTDTLARALGLHRVLAVFATAALLNVSYWTGKTLASFQTEFLVVEGRQNAVVLRVYGQKVISALFDDKKQLTGVYTVEEIGAGSQFMLKKTHLGRLTSPLQKPDRPQGVGTEGQEPGTRESAHPAD